MDNGSGRRAGGVAGQKADAARQERLAQALRANLKRRKAQIRDRAAASPVEREAQDKS